MHHPASDTVDHDVAGRAHGGGEGDDERGIYQRKPDQSIGQAGGQVARHFQRVTRDSFSVSVSVSISLGGSVSVAITLTSTVTATVTVAVTVTVTVTVKVTVEVTVEVTVTIASTVAATSGCLRVIWLGWGFL